MDAFEYARAELVRFFVADPGRSERPGGATAVGTLQVHRDGGTAVLNLPSICPDGSRSARP